MFGRDIKKQNRLGIFRKQITVFTHRELNHLEGAVRTLSNRQKLTILILLTLLLTGLSARFHATLVVLVAGLSLLYFADLIFNCFLIVISFVKKPEIHIAPQEVNWLLEEYLPTYTILCPLYKEEAVLPQFVKAISSLDYPKDKLQVLLLLEQDDINTIEAATNIGLPEYFEIAIVPSSWPKTKPKALNFGLTKAVGQYVVIYDAEDVPERDQLKKAILAFEKAGSDTKCIQAKLSFYNPNQNFLTRFFAIEYSLWFELVLTGLQSINAPIPLGGTSNHFKTRDIVSFQGWDPYNVTEDADLGMRIAKRGFKTAILNSTTYEEANSNALNWLNQRSRWIKGYMQTYFVHCRSLGYFLNSGNKTDLFSFQLVVGGKILSMLVNPLMWFLTLSYFIFRPIIGSAIESFFPKIIFYLALASLVFGNFLYVYYYMVGAAKSGKFELVIYSLLIPFYWLFMSVAAIKAVIELTLRPYIWNKTEHGLHIKNDPGRIDNFLVTLLYNE